MRVRLPLLLLIIFAPALVHALGLGKLELESGLNEPFEARIELLSPTVEELDSLNVRLADEAAFSRAGIPRLSLLRSLNFVVKESDIGTDYIRIYSNDPIREPFLNFLLEVSWSKGRLYREYTVLLDPPVYASPEKQRRLAPAPTPPASTTGTITREPDHQVVYDPVYKPARTTPATPVSRPISYDGGDYGPTVSGDTLWSIASAMRPDSSVSVQQMMFALLRANPEAFINGNINGLKRGHVLNMPDMSDVRSLSRDEAFAQTKLQNGLWEEARGALATAVTPRPEAVVSEEPVTQEPVVTPEPVVVPPVEGEPELRLVAPAEAGEGVAGVTDTSSEQLANELALATESLEALTQENLELKDKLSETEAIIDDLKRLIVLKESELAALQQQIAADEAAKAAAELEEAAEQVTEEIYEEEVTEITEVVEEPFVEEGLAEEEIEETDAIEDTDVVMEDEDMEITETESEEVTGIPATSFIPAGIAGLVDQIKSNLNYLAIGLGAILLIAIGALVVKRKRSEEATVIPQSAFPDFDEHAEEPAKVATDINPVLAADSEAVTILPGAEEEAAEPAFEEDVTKVVPPEEQAEKASAPAADEEEEDPFTEVNYFLAYEQYDQAEELVKKVIAKDPDNFENHTKLLEVYYAANNKKGYEEAARVLHDMVNGQGEYWNMAVAMWQEISPNRALFAESQGDEEETGAAAGGGIVNITGDEGATAGLDLELDATAGSGDVLDMTSVEEDADILDVTAAIDMDDDAVLDVTSATDDSAAGEEAATESRPADDNSLDFAIDFDNDESKAEASASDMDIPLEMPEAEEDAAITATAEDDGSLDFAIDIEKEEPKEEAPAGELDISLDMSQPEEGVEENADDNSLDFSIDIEKDEGKEESSTGVDFSVDTPEAEEEAAAADDESSLDFSIDIEKDEAKEESSTGVDFSVDTPEAEEEAAAADDESSLDFSFDLENEEAKEEPVPDVLDTSFNVTDDDDKTGKADLLDVTSAISFDEDEEAAQSEGSPAGEDLLDVTKTRNFEPDSHEDLLDVTSATSAAMDADELLDSTKAGMVKEAEDNLVDFELSPDSAASGEDDSGLAFDGIDITAGQDSSTSTGIDFNIETDSGSDAESEIDMDGTMQIPKRTALDSEPEIENATPPSSDAEFELVLDEEDDDADHTIMVPKSAGTAQQSEEDEIASQLDLAKAYVELGDADNAKTILNEIIAIGNADQQQQARELLGQI